LFLIDYLNNDPDDILEKMNTEKIKKIKNVIEDKHFLSEADIFFAKKKESKRLFYIFLNSLNKISNTEIIVQDTKIKLIIKNETFSIIGYSGKTGRKSFLQINTNIDVSNIDGLLVDDRVRPDGSKKGSLGIERYEVFIQNEFQIINFIDYVKSNLWLYSWQSTIYQNSTFRRISKKIHSNQIITEEELKSKFPLAYQYLLSVKNELNKRDNGNPNPTVWYAFGRTQSLDTSFGKKIIFSPMNKKPNFIYYQNSECTFYSGYCIKFNGDNQKLLDQLNSERMGKFIAISSRDYRGGWKAYNKKILEEFIIPLNY